MSQNGTAGGTQRRKRTAGYYDYNLLLCLILLMSFGLIMLYSASAYEAYTSSNITDNMYFFKHQLRNSFENVLSFYGEICRVPVCAGFCSDGAC